MFCFILSHPLPLDSSPLFFPSTEQQQREEILHLIKFCQTITIKIISRQKKAKHTKEENIREVKGIKSLDGGEKKQHPGFVSNEIALGTVQYRSACFCFT